MNFSKLAIAPIVSLALLGCGGEEPEPKTPANTVTPAVQAPQADLATDPGHGTGMTTDTSGTGTGMGTASGAGGMGTTTTPAMDTKPSEPALTDEQIAAIADTINKGEVEEGKVASTKAKNAKVKQFAQMMVKHHTEAKDQQAKLLTKLKVTPQENAMATQLKSDADKSLADLKGKAGADFDKAYIEAQVKEHEQALHTMDEKLLPAAKNTELKAFLTEVRGKVSSHLDQAKQLQSTMK